MITAQDCSGVLYALHAHGAEFIVVGGVAMAAHGYRQHRAGLAFNDLDLCILREPANIARLRSALTPFHPACAGPPPLSRRYDWAQGFSLAGLRVCWLDTLAGRVDLIAHVDGIGRFPEVLAVAQRGYVFGVPCHLLSLEGLIASKSAVGRPKDYAALPELCALAGVQ